MNARQTEMARHALGLVDGRKRSYRNRYCVNFASPDFQLWVELVQKGLATSDGAVDGGRVNFCLERAGAEAVLERGEILDPEDFPAAEAAE